MTQVDLEGVTFTLLVQGEDYRVTKREIPAEKFYVDSTGMGLSIAAENHETGANYATIDIPEAQAQQLAHHILEVLEE